MSVIGPCASNAPPTHQAPSPVPFTRRQLIHERTELHRLRTLPATVGIPIIRNTRIRAATRAGEHEQPGVSCNESPQSIAFHTESIEHLAARIASTIEHPLDSRIPPRHYCNGHDSQRRLLLRPD